MKKHVLIVEDDSSFRKLLQYGLSQEYLVAGVENGQEAIDSLKVLSADLIITDINMPLLNGFELIAFLRKHPLYREIPIIVVSSFDESVFDHQMSWTEVSGYFQKPVDVNVLKENVDSLLQNTVVV